MKARLSNTNTSPNTRGESRKFTFFHVPSWFRKRRVSVTRMGAWESYPSNHGTKPSLTSYSASRLPSMATATATAPTTTQYASTAAAPLAAASGKAPTAMSPYMDFAQNAVTVERDEAWVQQLQDEQNQRFDIQVAVMYKEFLNELESAGPYATAETRAEIERRYEERLKQMKQLQQEEFEQHIEMERQERLWSLGQEDPDWDGWHRLYEEQASILANIKKDPARSGRNNSDQRRRVDERIIENEREREDTLRRNEEWQKTEAQRVLDRQRWAETQRLTNYHLGERRQRDMAEAQAYEEVERAREEETVRLTEEARQGAAQLRGRASQAALNAEFQSTGRPALTPLSETSSRASVSDSIFSSSPSTAETASSSVGNERWHPTETAPNRPSASRPIAIPTSPPEELRRSSSGSFGGGTRPAGAGTQSSSPLSSTPTSNTMAHAKGEDHTRWIPPDATREPKRQGSMQFDAARDSAPGRKASMLFGASPVPAPPPTLDDPPRGGQIPRPRPAPSPQSQQPFPTPSSAARQSQSQTQQTRATPSPQPPSHAPNAPGMRSQPLPQSQPQAQPQPQPQAQFASTSASRQNSYPAPPPLSTSFSTSHTPPPTTIPRATPSPLNAGATAAPATSTPTKPSPPVDEYRAKLRKEYVRQEEQRVEEERRRREQEANEQRAEDARRRGAEKRKQEEQAREAERREAERKARKTSTSSMRLVPDRPVSEVWSAYESQWAAMASSSQLRFRSIPWPVLMPVSSPDMLLPIHIASFILNTQHSQGKARKDRLREALLRWHPDRFESKWLKKVVEEERDSVQEGVGHVVRALNDLMSTEGTFAA